MDPKKIELFERSSIPSAVATLCIPAVLSTLVMILYNIADTYFVGMLADPIESAAVSLAAPVLLAFNAITNLFGVGGSSMMSRSLGRHDYETVKTTASFCFWLSMACALLISLAYVFLRSPLLRLLGADASTAAATARYLRWTVAFGAVPAILNVVLSNLVRSEGEAKQAGIGVISGCLLNIVLDPFFVLPRFLGMGAAGAGLATMISNAFAMLYLLAFIFRKRGDTNVCLDPRRFCFRKDICKEVFGVGIPASIQNLLNVTGSLILNNLTAGFGAAAVSAMGISHKVSLMSLYLTMGMGQGIMPLVSYNYAGGSRQRMKDAILFVMKIGGVITVTITALTWAFAPGLIRLFMPDEEVVAYGTRLLRAMCLEAPFLALDFTTVAVFQAIGKGSWSLIFAVCRKIVLEIPAIILFNRLLPLYGMGYSQPFAELILAAAAALMLRKIFRMRPPEENTAPEAVE